MKKMFDSKRVEQGARILDALELDQDYGISERSGELVGELDAIAWNLLKDFATAIAELSAQIIECDRSLIGVEAFLRIVGSRAKVGFHILWNSSEPLDETLMSLRSRCALRLLVLVSGNGGLDDMTLDFESLPPDVEAGILEIAEGLLASNGGKSCSPALLISIAGVASQTRLSGKLANKPRQEPRPDMWTITARVDGLIVNDREAYLIEKHLKRKSLALKFNPTKYFTALKDRLGNDKNYRFTLKEAAVANGAIECEILQIEDVLSDEVPDPLELKPSPRDDKSAGGSVKKPKNKVRRKPGQLPPPFANAK